MRIYHVSLYGICLVCALLITSCGNHESTPAVGMGTVRFRIHWPAATRVLPKATQSLSFNIAERRSNDSLHPIITKVVARPTDASVSEVTLKLPSVAVHVLISAKADATGTDLVDLATGSLSFTVLESKTITQAVTLTSAITRVAVSPVSVKLNEGMSTTFSATAYDSMNRLVLVDPSSWSWQTPTSPAFAFSSSTGNSISCSAVQRLMQTYTVKVTESDSGQSALATIEPPRFEGTFRGKLTKMWILGTGAFTQEVMKMEKLPEGSVTVTANPDGSSTAKYDSYTFTDPHPVQTFNSTIDCPDDSGYATLYIRLDPTTGNFTEARYKHQYYIGTDEKTTDAAGNEIVLYSWDLYSEVIQP
jgi:hypothetical protein